MILNVGRAVASDTRDPRFESGPGQNFIYQLYNRKVKNKEKVAGNGPPLIKSFLCGEASEYISRIPVGEPVVGISGLMSSFDFPSKRILLDFFS